MGKKKGLLERKFGYLWRPWGGQHRRHTPQVRIYGWAAKGWGGDSKIKMLASKVKVLGFGFPESIKIMSGDHGGLLVTLVLEAETGFLKKTG